MFCVEAVEGLGLKALGLSGFGGVGRWELRVHLGLWGL